MSFETLADLLQQTRIALLDGDFEALDHLAHETGLLIDSPLREDETELAQLRAMADENAALIEAAARGVTAAKNRLARPDAFSTYDSHGQRGAVPRVDAGKTLRF